MPFLHHDDTHSHPPTGLGQLHGVTVNRRAGVSPYLHKDSIDPNLAVMRVDDGKGSPLATVWNFAIHGTCWGPEQLLSNGDIMGGANEAIENLIGGVSLFINADAGDIAPCKKFTRAIGDVCVHARACACVCEHVLLCLLQLLQHVLGSPSLQVLL